MDERDEIRGADREPVPAEETIAEIPETVCPNPGTAPEAAPEAVDEDEAEGEDPLAKEFEAAIRKAHQTKQPPNGKKILAIILVILAAAAAAVGGWFYYTKTQAAMDGLVEAFLTVDASDFTAEDSIWKDTYPKYSDKARVEEDLVSGLGELAGKGDLTQIGDTLQVMEALGYTRDSIKTVVDTEIQAAKTAAFQDSDHQRLFDLLNDVTAMGGLTYYTSFEKFFPAEELTAELRTRAETVCSGGDAAELAAFVAGLEPFCGVQDQADDGEAPETGYLQADDVLPAGLLLDTAIAQAEPAIFRSGEGGYYDFTGEGGGRQSRGAAYYGDFMTIRAGTTQDEGATDSESLYFRGKTIAAVGTFEDVLDREAQTVLIWDDVIVAVGQDWIALLRNEASQSLTYAEEIDLSAWELEPERTADLTDTAVFEEIDVLLQEKLEDYKAELRYDVDSQELQILVTAPVDNPADMGSSWALLSEQLMELYDQAVGLCDDAGYTVSCAAYIVKNSNDTAVLYCIRDGVAVYDAAEENAGKAPTIGGALEDPSEESGSVGGNTETIPPGSIDPDEAA